MPKLNLLFLLSFLCNGIFAQTNIINTASAVWELQTFLPGKGSDINYSGNFIKVPYTRSINELIQNGFEFRDSAGHPIKASEVEFHYWKYRCRLDNRINLKQRKNICLRSATPEPYSLFLLNGNPVTMGVSNNIPVWKAMPSAKLNDRDNLLEVLLPALFDAGSEELKRSGFDKWPADNDTAMFKTSVVLRKPPVQFGWDVAPRMVLNGLGKGIELIPFDHMMVVDDWIQTLYTTPYTARMKVRWLVYADSSAETRFQARLDGKLVIDTIVAVDAGQNEIFAEFETENPKLWAPVNTSLILGQNKKPGLYRWEQLVVAGRDTFSKTTSIGIRTAELKQNIDFRGREFVFAINGQTVKARGANIVPPAGYEAAKLRKALWQGQHSLLNELAASGYNMVRIWGGGGLMDDEFYSKCDSLGLMVWQDLMYSGTTYPYDGAWKKKALADVVGTVQQLRNHPGMVLYCGNNEIDVALKHWGWERTYSWSKEDSVNMRKQYNAMFARDFRLVIAEADPATPYLPSTPVSNWAPTEQMRYGDNHLWFVWHGERPVTDFDRIVPRFASEYGFPSWPSYYTVRKHFGNNSAISRMLSYKGIRLLEKYMTDEFGILPKDTHALILLSQYLQARTLVRAARAHLKDSTCGGTLYWQLNDIWPGITWSTVDFEGRKKAAWFAMRSIYLGLPGWIEPLNDPKKLVNPEWKITRKNNRITIKVKNAAMGIMILQNGALVNIYNNVLDMPAGAAMDLVLPDDCGSIEITSVWHLMNGQGFLRK